MHFQYKWKSITSLIQGWQHYNYKVTLFPNLPIIYFPCYVPDIAWFLCQTNVPPLASLLNIIRIVFKILFFNFLKAYQNLRSLAIVDLQELVFSFLMHAHQIQERLDLWSFYQFIILMEVKSFLDKTSTVFLLFLKRERERTGIVFGSVTVENGRSP